MYLIMLQEFINRRRRKRTAGRSPLDEGLGITIRFAYPDDAPALRRLAALDSKRVPRGSLLVAEVAGELWVAVSITGEGTPIADPFKYTAELITILQERAYRLSRAPRRAHAPQHVGRPVYE